jgi:hypothetical protein
VKKIKSMKYKQRVTPVFKLPGAKVVKDIIDKNSKKDWLHHMGYADCVILYATKWQQWDSARYAIKSSDELMGDIYTCRVKFSKCSISLSAGKIHPQTKMSVSVDQVEHEMADVDSAFEKTKGLITERKEVIPNRDNAPGRRYSLMGESRVSV